MGIEYNPRKREITVTGVAPDEWKRFPKIKALQGVLDAKNNFVISLRCSNQVFALRDIVMIQPVRWGAGKAVTRHLFKVRGFSLFEVKQGTHIGYTLSGNVIPEESE